MSDNRGEWTRNMALAVVAGQAGCSTIVIVVGALLLGLWLDAQAGQRGPFTILLIILSVPLSLGVMFTVAMSAIRSIRPPVIEKRDDSVESTEEV